MTAHRERDDETSRTDLIERFSNECVKTASSLKRASTTARGLARRLKLSDSGQKLHAVLCDDDDRDKVPAE